MHVVHAKREVVLCAGYVSMPTRLFAKGCSHREHVLSALRSSSLLELSGIGNKDILGPLGIQTIVHNPAVGENVQEHTLAAVTWGELALCLRDNVLCPDCHIQSYSEIDQEKYGFETIDLFADPAAVAKNVKL